MELRGFRHISASALRLFCRVPIFLTREVSTGLFSNLRKGTDQTSAQDETARAVIAMPLLVAAADGVISAPETTQITNMCTFSPVFHAVGPERTMELAGDVIKELKAKGATEVFTRGGGALAEIARDRDLFCDPDRAGRRGA